MMAAYLRNSIFLCLFVLGACSVTSVETQRDTIAPITLNPASLGRNLAVSQIVVGEYGDKSYKMRFEVEITQERLTVVGLSPLGVTLFTLTQNRDAAPVVTAPKGGLPFDPKYLLFDLYLTYWPTAILRASFTQRSLRLIENTDRSIRRVISMSGEVLVEKKIGRDKRNRRETIIQHFDTPYRLRIRTIGGS